MAQIDTNANINFKRDKSYFMEKKPHKWKCSRLLLSATYQVCLVDGVFSTDSPHSYGYQLCPSIHRLVTLLFWSRLHAGASQRKRNETFMVL